MAPQGLTSRDAHKRLNRFGLNEITARDKKNPVRMLFSQFTSPIILILIGAAVISLLLTHISDEGGANIDAALIIIIVIVSGIAGFIQEYKSEKTIQALKKIAAPQARVIRDGREQIIDARNLVPDDTLLIETGDIIPADTRILSTNSLEIDESLLSGESLAVVKKSNDIIYMGTSVSKGSAIGIVRNTGMKTRMGTIANRLATIDFTATPFHNEIGTLSKKLIFIIGIAIALFTAVAIARYNIYQALLTGVALAVAAIPEGIPALLVFVLAQGARSMARKKALVKKLAAIESVGAIDVICTDKTGTLTQNRMAVRGLMYNDTVYTASEVTRNSIERLLACATLCNNARLITKDNGDTQYTGDQTEIALLQFAALMAHGEPSPLHRENRITEFPFTSERMMMSVLYRNREGAKKLSVLYTKGAPEKVLALSSNIDRKGKQQALGARDKQNILKQYTTFANKGFRVLGFAYKNIQATRTPQEQNLTWLGLIALADPPRAGIREALQECKTAGIRVIMLTGDTAATAQAIADEIGLESTGVMAGNELEKNSNKELKKILDTNINIFYRVSPLHKIRILLILQKKNRVAMTGDGVNDALALKQADVGIAMGERGTAVAREASDIILLDDNFVTIKTAIREGRKIFDNIRKFLNYLLTSNFAEVLVLLSATIFLSLKEPILLPIHLLWINLLTDGLPALALGNDPARPDIMLHRPRKRGEGILSKRLALLIGIIGTKKAVILLATFFLTLPLGFDVARTTLLTGFVLYEFVRIGSIRFQEKLTWSSNIFLLAALALSVVLQLIIIYSPLNTFFHAVPLGWYAWGVLAGGIIIGYLSAIFITQMVLQATKENDSGKLMQ